MIKVIYEDNHLLVVEKPVNIPVMEDISNDQDLLSILKNELKIKYNKPGNVYLGLVHRLDRPVGGVMVFAKTSKAASRLSEQVRTNQMHKQYYAVCCSTSLKKQDTLKDFLYKDSKTNTSKVVDKNHQNAKEAILEYELVDVKDDLSLVRVNLITGRSHQIRVQFSNVGAPLWGDQKYNKNAKVKEQIALWSTSISFKHPITNEVVTFRSIPENKPFNLFKEVIK